MRRARAAAPTPPRAARARRAAASAARGSLFPNEETVGGGGSAPIAPGGVVPGERERPEDPARTSCVTSPAVCYAEVFDPNGHGNLDLEQKLIQCKDKDTWRKAAVKRREAGVVEGRERRERRERSE